ncbi:hypothetical protein K505DRAFT_205690, partial [Melanomma pulvis-pyrius CBS 109.77]
MPDPLSLAASSFAVIGVADVVLRVGVECCRFLSEIKDAPAEIDSLRTCIKDNLQLVDTLKKHSDDLRDPAPPMSLPATDASSALDGFNSSIRALHRELNALQALAKKHSGIDKTWARVKWILDERKINKSLEKLERSKSTLGVALSLLEGFVLHSQPIHCPVHADNICLQRRRSAFSQKRSNVLVQQNFQRITSTMDGQLQELSIVRATQEKVLSGQEKVILQSTQQSKKTSLLRKDLLKATRTDQSEHAKTQRKIADGNRKVINTISSKLDDLCISVPKVPIVAKNSNREIYFFGERRESILTPLVLMKDLVQWAVLHSLSHHADRLSSQHLYWLRSEFDKLVSSATQEAAAFCQGSTATPFDQWNYLTRGNTLPDTGVPLGSPIATDYCEGDDRKMTPAGSNGVVHQRGFRSKYEVFSFSSPAGQLHLTVSRTSDIANSARSIEEAHLSFIPTRGICSNSIKARFVKSINSGFEPRLYTQLNAFRLVEDYDLHMKLCHYGSIEDIDAAFRSGLAALGARSDVLQYFDSQGVGQSNLNGGGDILDGFWFSICDVSQRIPDDSFAKMQAYCDEICPLIARSSLLHPLAWDTGEVSDKNVHLTKMWMEFLKRNDYDFELQDGWGDTPLLDNLSLLGKNSLENTLLLLGFGANPHAVNSDGRNAIQAAMASNIFSNYPEKPEILEEKLSLLIEAGVDIHHRDKRGETPSHDARKYYKCWTVWCRALDRNGRKIDEVVREDGELWLLEESSEEGESNKEGE